MKKHALIALLFIALPVWAGLSDTIVQVKPSVVVVASFNKLAAPALSIRGTGFIVGDGSLVCTNSHVIPEALAENEHLLVFVGQGNDRAQREAKLVRRDAAHDLALLKISGAPLPAFKLSSPSMMREGHEVAISGFPIGNIIGTSMVTHRGIVSAITPIAVQGGHSSQLNEAAIRRLRSGAFDVYQLDITAYPGSSGSPMYDTETADVVGIVNSGFVKGSKEAALSNPTGITFAIPVRYLHELLGTKN